MGVTGIDHVIVAVRDLDAATQAYARLLGRPPSLCGTHPAQGTANAIFQLDNTYVELLAPADAPPPGQAGALVRAHLDSHGEGLFGIALATDDIESLQAAWRAAGLSASRPQPGEGAGADGSLRRWRSVFLPPADTQGLVVFAIEHESPPETRPVTAPEGPADACPHAVDHVVVNTPDADRSIALYRDAMGIRLALDRDAPQWGARMLFFRPGRITLEVVQRYGADGKPGQPDETPGEPHSAQLWGMAFNVRDVAAARARLAGAGLDVSPVRAGRKPGTAVFIVRDGTCGVPTLVIGPAED